MNTAVNNIILISLTSGSLDKEKLSKVTGISNEELEIFLDKLVKDDLVSLQMYGNTLIDLSSVDESYIKGAIEVFKKIREVSPTHPKANVSLAVIYMAKGEIKKSREELEKALLLKPDYTRAKELLERVNMPRI